MNPQFWWYVSRASGMVAWALSASTILWGLALATRALGARPRAPWLNDLHRYLGGLTVLFVLAHLGALVADSYTDFGIADLLVPFASDWKPGAVAWGVVAFWGLLAVELSSLAMKRIPKRTWHAIHMTSYLVFAGATVHLVTAGTDAANPVTVAAVTAAVAGVGFFSVYRWVGPGRAASVKSSKGRKRATTADQPSRAERRSTTSPEATHAPTS